jgi:serine/threonine-protein kinase
MALQPGDTLLNGQYRIIRQIGKGGFGSVYLAQDTHLREQVAIKELIPGLVGDEAMLKRFLAEAKTTLRLTHPRIVRTHHVFPGRGNYYIAMEYMPGGSLEERLREQGPVAVREALRVAVHVCEGLSYAHQQGVVHCDLKPANILFDAGLRTGARASAKVADFGIAHVSEEILTRTWQTPQGFVAGTLPYMSPEQTDGIRNDPRVDVYALGAILYRMLTGRTYLDFDQRETPSAQAHNVMRIHRQDPVPPSAHNHRVPGWLDAVVMKALAKHPEDRYATTRDLRSALVRQPGAALPQARPPASSSEPRGRRRRKVPSPPWLWPLAGVAAVLLLLVAVLALAVGDGNRDPSPAPTVTAAAGIEVIPTGQPTVAPTVVPRLDGDPRDWLPSPNDIPQEMVLSASEEYSNETIARQYDNPTGMFNRLREWGRITGYGDTYLHTEGCASLTGLREIFVEAVLFETESGAQAQFAWFQEQRQLGGSSLETLDSVGTSAHAVWSDLASDCTPPDDLRRVHISFQRYNAIGVASVASVKGTISDEEMRALCVRLAQLIDLRFVAEAQ